MISKITKIKNIGVYQNYRWNPNLSDFKEFNLIYGWNYAGKTTLSRILRCVQLNRLHNVSSNVEYELINSDGNICTHELIRSENIKVFNSDYVEENVKWEIGSVTPILILGEDSIQLEEEKREHERGLADLKLQKQNKINEQIGILEAIKNLKTTVAREIGTLLGIRPFDSRHLEKYIELEKNIEHYRKHVLDDILFDTTKNYTLSNDKRDDINKIIFDQIPNDLPNKLNDLLNKRIQNQLTISDFVEDQILSNWVNIGLGLHEGENHCKFCGNQLSVDLLSNLWNHFSKEYENYIRDLNGLKAIFEKYKDNLNKLDLPNENLLYAQLRQCYSESKIEVIESSKNYLHEVEQVLENINFRINNVFDSNKLFHLRPIATIDISKINKFITDHNSISTEFDSEKARAREAIIRHLVARLILDNNLHKKQNDLSETYNNLAEIESKIQYRNSEILRIEKVISSSTRGVEHINKFLSLYFGKEDIKIHLKNVNSYELKRQNHVVKNLSEGEKTAIAFAYFIASLKESGNILSNTIVYIDDPISSLDSNHLFNTYAFIKDTFYKFDRASNPKHICNCKQLFISTHNFEFFNLLKDWLGKMKSEIVSYYLIEKSEQNISDLKALPDILLKHKSEYSYLFSVLYTFNQNPTHDFNQLYSLPNIIRRFLESFMTFKYLSSVNIEENLEIVIENPIQAERVRKFAHYYSHNLSTTRLLTLSNVSECSEIVEIVLNAVKIKDEVHYNALVQNIQ